MMIQNFFEKVFLVYSLPCMTKKAIFILLVLYLQSSMYYIYVTLYSFSFHIITTTTNYDLKRSDDNIEDILFYLKVYNTKKEALNLFQHVQKRAFNIAK